MGVLHRCMCMRERQRLLDWFRLSTRLGTVDCDEFMQCTLYSTREVVRLHVRVWTMREQCTRRRAAVRDDRSSATRRVVMTLERSHAIGAHCTSSAERCVRSHAACSIERFTRATLVTASSFSSGSCAERLGSTSTASVSADTASACNARPSHTGKEVTLIIERKIVAIAHLPVERDREARLVEVQLLAARRVADVKGCSRRAAHELQLGRLVGAGRVHRDARRRDARV